MCRPNRKKEYIRLNNVSENLNKKGIARNLNISLYENEIHALVGDRYPGIEGLINILIGNEKQYTGDIYYKENTYENIVEMLKERISYIRNQEGIIESLTVPENIFFLNGRRSTKQWISSKKMRSEATRIFEDLGIHEIGLEEEPNSLTNLQIQLLLITRSYSSNPEMIIIDGITSFLDDIEAERLFEIIKTICAKGIAVLYVATQNDEVAKYADRVSIIRKGTVIATTEIKERSTDALYRLIANPMQLKTSDALNVNSKKKTVLKVSNMKIAENIALNFELYETEIFWIIGLKSSIRKKLAEAVCGIKKINGTQYFLDGKEIEIKTPFDAIRNKMGYIPENALESSLIPDIAIERNITFGVLDKLTSHGFVNEKMERYVSQKWIRQFDIKSHPNDASDAAEELDKCKAVIARLLTAHPRILVIDNPMRGIVYELRARVMDYIRKMASEGTTVLILSTDLGELIHNTDRILMLSKNGMQIELEDHETSACFNNKN